MKDNKRFWSRNARIYERFTRGTKSAKRAYQEMEDGICSLLKPSMEVLELAAGPGIMSVKIAQSCAHLEITDFSTQMLAQAKKKSYQGKVSFAIADATDLKYDDHSFDAVVIANALHIMPDPVAAVQEIKRVLRQGGILIAPTFTREKTEFRVILKLMELFGFKTFSKWDHASYRLFLEKQGFTILNDRVILGHNFPIAFIAGIR